MSSITNNATRRHTQDSSLFGRICERVGLPKALAVGFLGLLLFMVGDGVEAGYLAPFLSSHGVSNEKIALLFTVYGVTVSISS